MSPALGTSIPLISDSARAWSAGAIDESGISDVAHTLDAEFIRESTRPIVQRLARGLDVAGVPTGGDVSSKFFSSTDRKGKTVSKLMLFWEFHVPEDEPLGFFGRHFAGTTEERILEFKKSWKEESLDGFEALELRALARFVTEEEVASPSSTAARCLLSRMISAPPRLDIRHENDLPTPNDLGTCEATLPGPSSHREGPLIRNPSGYSRGGPPEAPSRDVDSTDDESSSDDDLLDRGVEIGTN